MAHTFAYLANHFVFLPHFFAMIFISFKNFKTPNMTRFSALAGQIQHMAAQKVQFTLRPIRYDSFNWQVSSLAALELGLHSRAKLDTYQRS